MIYYVPQPEEVEKVYGMFRGNNRIVDMMEEIQGKYLYRIVQSKNELRERLFIFDAGLDDRAIEIIKVFYFNQLRRENPELQIDEILFESGDNGELGLIFFTDCKPVASCQLQRDFYDIIVKEYIYNMPDIREDEIIIDWKWAVEVVKNRK